MPSSSGGVQDWPPNIPKIKEMYSSVTRAGRDHSHHRDCHYHHYDGGVVISTIMIWLHILMWLINFVFKFDFWDCGGNHIFDAPLIYDKWNFCHRWLNYSSHHRRNQVLISNVTRHFNMTLWTLAGIFDIAVGFIRLYKAEQITMRVVQIMIQVTYLAQIIYGGSPFMTKNAGHAKFQYGRHFPGGHHEVSWNVIFCLEMVVNGQKRLLWQQSVFFAHAKCTVNVMNIIQMFRLFQCGRQFPRWPPSVIA